MKNKILATLLIAVLSLASSGVTGEAETIKTIDDLYGNIFENGTFENDVNGWTAPEGASVSRETKVTYGDSAGSAKIYQHENAKQFTYTKTNLRNNRFYKVTAKIKLENNASGLAANIIAEVNNGDKISKLSLYEEAPMVTSDDWLTLDGYLINSVRGSQTNVGKSDPEAENYLREAKIYVQITGGSQGISYYLDDIIITGEDGSVNSDFKGVHGTTSYGYRAWNSDLKMVDFDAEEEGVQAFVSSGEFPDTDKVLYQAPAASSCQTPSVAFAADKGEEYELSIWIKIIDDIEDGTLAVFVSPLYGGNKTSFITARKFTTSPSNKGWQHIVMTLIYPESGVNPVGDAEVSVRLVNGGDI